MHISRGFHGRHREAADLTRMPPGQYVTSGFPVLSAGPTPRVALDQWSFVIRGELDEPRSWTWDELQALPREDITVDIHCVTKWSKLDTDWTGRLDRHAAGRRRHGGRARAGVLRRRLHHQPAAGGRHRRQGRGSPSATTASRSTRSTAARRGCWCRTSTSGRAPSGCAGSSCGWTTSPASGRATATTTTAIRGASSATPATELAARHRRASCWPRPTGRPASCSTCPDWPGHRAGQHVDVRLTAEDGYQAQRSYSIASAPEDDVARADGRAARRR